MSENQNAAEAEAEAEAGVPAHGPPRGMINVIILLVVHGVALGVEAAHHPAVVTVLTVDLVVITVAVDLHDGAIRRVPVAGIMKKRKLSLTLLSGPLPPK